MKFTVIIDKEREEEVIIYAKERTNLVKSIEELLKREESCFTVQNATSIKRLTEEEIYCFTVDGGKVYVLTEMKNSLLRYVFIPPRKSFRKIL